jgi:peptide/nickel transport system substrate-binding protein
MALPILLVATFAGSAPGAAAETSHVVHLAAGHAGGNITDAWGIQPDTLNPATTGDTTSNMVDRNIFDSLVYETPSGDFQPWLATSWTITDGGKVYTFQLRKGVTFQDGTPFNAAEEVAYVGYVQNPSTHAIGTYTDLKSVKATGPYTVQFTLTEPYAPFLTNLASPQYGPQSITAINKWGKQYSEHIVGTGPFELKSYTPGTGFVLVKNPHYDWAPAAFGRNGPAYLNQITYQFIDSPTVGQDELETGEAQVLEAASTIAYKTFKTNPSYTELYIPINGAGVYSPFDLDKAPTNDLKVRQAILYAVNRQGVQDLADQGQYQLTWGPIQKGTFGYDPKFNGMYNYDPAKAAQLLESDGYKKVKGFWTKDGKKLTLVIDLIAGAGDFDTMGTAIQGYLEKFGIDATTRTLEVDAWTSGQLGHEYNMATLQFSDDDPSVMEDEFGCKQYFDWIGECNAQLDKYLAAGQDTTNTAQRLKDYEAAETIVMNQALVMPLRLDENLDVFSSKLHGMVDYSGGDLDWYNAYLSQ